MKKVFQKSFFYLIKNSPYRSLCFLLTTEWKCELSFALSKGRNDLPHILLASSPSALASQLPHLTSRSLPNNLPPRPQHHYLFIHSYLQGKVMESVPACPELSLISSAVTEEAKLLHQTWRWASLQPPLPVGCCNWDRPGWVTAASIAFHTLEIRVDEHLVAGGALLSGWP